MLHPGELYCVMDGVLTVRRQNRFSRQLCEGMMPQAFPRLHWLYFGNDRDPVVDWTKACKVSFTTAGEVGPVQMELARSLRIWHVNLTSAFTARASDDQQVASAQT